MWLRHVLGANLSGCDLGEDHDRGTSVVCLREELNRILQRTCVFLPKGAMTYNRQQGDTQKNVRRWHCMESAATLLEIAIVCFFLSSLLIRP